MGRNFTLTQSQIAWAKNAWLNGTSDTAIAEKLGVHKNTIANYARNGWILPTPKRKFYTVYDRNDRIVATGTARECAKQLHLTYNSFKSSVSKCRKGLRQTYTVLVDDTPWEE